MNWLGMLIGSYIGGSVGHLPGSIIGAFIGYKVAQALSARKGGGRPRTFASGGDRAQVFCGSVAAMLAKMAKADGVVTRDEIAGVEEAFRRLGFSPAARQYAIGVFRKAKDDRRTIFEYAADFAAAVDSVEVRELFYEILWDVACADGRVGPNEHYMLHHLPRVLRIRSAWYDYFASQRFGGRADGRRAAAPRDPLADAYAVLGASASDGADELKRKYRELAKRNHPDALRAQGLPEEMVGKATERMSRINDAWATIRAARGL